MSYKRSDHLSRHLIKHEADNKPFSCSQCIQKFSNKSHLKRHIKNVHQSEIYRCCICFETFKKKVCLRNHEESHGIGNKLSCYMPFCSKTFWNQDSLKNHIESHKLSLANKKDNQLIGRKRLREIEKEEKSYKCPFDGCLKVYSTSYNLKVHVKSFHFNEKHFRCQECGKEFSHKCSLERHVTVDHGEKELKEMVQSVILSC